MKLSRDQLACSILIVLFHAVGLSGFLLPAFTELFKQLVPAHLLLMLVLMIISQQERSRFFAAFLIITYMAGFLIELAGIHTGLIFGRYSYGSTLGLKLAGVPLMIGVNWILVVYSAGMLLQRVAVWNKFAAVMAGAGLVSLLDWLIEPVAVRFDYWSWHSNGIPLQNYVAWFLFSCCLLWLFYRLPFNKNNPSGAVLFISQCMFFAILNGS